MITKEGALNSFDIIGEVYLTMFDPNKSKCKLAVEIEDMKNVQIRPHPNLNKQQWNEKKCIALKDMSEPFPLNSLIPTLKYKQILTNTADTPFTFTHWFNSGVLTMELEFNNVQQRFQNLNNIEILLNLPSNEFPEVKNVENSDFQIIQKDKQMKWLIPKLNSADYTCNIEIKLSEQCKQEDLFPILVNFSLDYTYLKITPKDCINLADNSNIKFDFSRSMVTEKF